MKNLILSILCLLFTVGLNAQQDKTSCDDCILDNSKCNTSDYCRNTVYSDSNGDAYNSVYRGMPIDLGNVLDRLSQSQANDKAKEGVKNKENILYQSLLIGYNLAKMDPFNPQNTGTEKKYIFNDLNSATSNNPKAYYYSRGSNNKNVPKFLNEIQETYSRSQEYIVNSDSDISQVLSENYGGSIGIKSIGISAKGSHNIKIKNSLKENELLAIYLDEKIVGTTYKLTEFATLNSRFIEQMVALKNDQANYNKFVEFFEKWGTHYADRLKNGQKSYKVKKYNSKELKSAIDMGYKLEAEGKIQGITASAKMESENSLASVLKKQVTKNDMREVGT